MTKLFSNSRPPGLNIEQMAYVLIKEEALEAGILFDGISNAAVIVIS